jgi:branched-chain amino acid transport system permease protein
MSELAQIVMSGIVTGCVFGLVGLTFTIVYNATKLLNFAQGEFWILGYLVGYVFAAKLGLPYFLALILAAVFGTMLGLLTNLFLVPLYRRNAPFFSMIIFLMGLSLIYGGGIGVATRFDYFRVPSFLPLEALKLGPVSILPQQVIVVAVTAILVLLYWLFTTRTIEGKALVATGYHLTLAKLLGIQTGAMMFLSFALSGAMSGIAALVGGPMLATHAMMGLPLVVNGFIAAIVGGLGNPYGSVVGGILVGILSALVAFYISPEYAQIIAIATILVVLTFFPKGLFGVQEEY